MNRRMFGVILFLVALDSVGISLVYPLFSSLLFHKHWQFVDSTTSEACRGFWLGVLLASPSLAQFIFSPLIGRLSDRYGRRPMVLGTTCVKLLGYIAATTSIVWKSLGGLLASRILLGIATCEYAVFNAAIADISDPVTKRKRFAQSNVVFGLGFAIGPCIGGALLAYNFMALPFLAAFLLSSCGALCVFLWFRETKCTDREQSQELPFWSAFRGIFVIAPRLSLLLLAVFLYCFGWSFYFDIIPTWWITGLGSSPQQVGRFMTYGAIWYAIGCGLVAGPISRCFPPMATLQWSLFFLAISIWAVVPFAAHSAAFWLLIPFHNLLASCVFPVCTMAVSDMASESQQGQVMGLHASAEAVGFSLSPIISGLSLGFHALMPVYIGGLSIFAAYWLVLAAQKMATNESTT